MVGGWSSQHRCQLGLLAPCIALLLVACGGQSSSDSNGDGVQPGQGGGGSGSGAAAGAPATNPPAPAPLELSSWPWFLNTAGAPDESEMVSSSEGVLALDFEPNSERVQLQTHHHFDLLSDHSALTFAAWANRPVTLIVAVTGLTFESDYWTDLEAGRPWLAVEVEVGVEPRGFELPFDGFSALGPGTPRSMGEPMGTVVWFLIDDADSLELRIADVRLE